MMEVAEKDPKSLILVIADMARSNPPMASSFVAGARAPPAGAGAALALPLTWIEQRLSEDGLTIEQLVQSETQEQAGDQVSISNSIGSLRFLGAMDWREFVEAMSVVEQTLREDPGGLYGRMDFATRDRYRHVVEEIAKGSPLSEAEVARKAIQLAHEAAAGVGGRNGDDDRAAHVGFYLIDEGRPRLEQAAAMRPSAAECAPSRGTADAACSSTSARSRRSPAALTAALLVEARAEGVADAALAGARRPAAAGHQPAGRGHGELAGDAAGDAAPAAAHGLLRGAPAAVAHAGGGPDDAHQRQRASRTWSRRWRSASSPIATPTCTSAC